MINTKYVYHDNHLFKVLGKVSMDITAVDFTGIDVNIGDWVTLFGNDDNKLEDVCSKTTNSPYSILTGIGNRVLRKYANN